MKKTTFLIDLVVLIDINIFKKCIEKIEKYEVLAIERVWKQDKVTKIPFIISAISIRHSKFIKNLLQLNLDPNLHIYVQKAVILKICNKVRIILKVINPAQTYIHPKWILAKLRDNLE